MERKIAFWSATTTAANKTAKFCEMCLPKRQGVSAAKLSKNTNRSVQKEPTYLFCKTALSDSLVLLKKAQNTFWHIRVCKNVSKQHKSRTANKCDSAFLSFCQMLCRKYKGAQCTPLQAFCGNYLNNYSTSTLLSNSKNFTEIFQQTHFNQAKIIADFSTYVCDSFLSATKNVIRQTPICKANKARCGRGKPCHRQS